MSWGPHLGQASSYPHIQEVWWNIMPKTRVTDRPSDKQHHLFLKTGRSPDNRAVMEEALP